MNGAAKYELIKGIPDNENGTVLLAVRKVNDTLIAIRTSEEAYFRREPQTKAARNPARLSHACCDEKFPFYFEVLDIERSLFEASVGKQRSVPELDRSA